MIVCVCNNISEGQIRKDPSLLEQCATNCGICSDTVELLQAELSSPNEQRLPFRDLCFYPEKGMQPQH
jgi:bacterioferritin-associated ferredoxin